ncbi:hypothetical protein LV89_02260 [Arcicella aurantiaca]|uniref:Uncharacterized protein n=1 Tax=Arcicella aurantiaca TaxID=591202 RepID=A0A316E7P8_9BACT|nr:hypothetical protein [Arcicella aurantiaca]PWK26751.1 hypothetical protein LV89_02260 [Arcicella aurantiaca]
MKTFQIYSKFKIVLAVSVLSLTFLCLQCATEKTTAQQNTKSVASPQKNEPIANFKTESPNEGIGEVVTKFPATLATVPIEKKAETFSPERFANVVYPTHLDKNLGFYLPNWIVTLHTSLSKVYKQKGIPLRSRGIWGSLDWKEHNIEGTEWNFFINPENGQAYKDNFNTRKSVNMNTFSSALPIEKRLQTGDVDLNNWDKKSEDELALMGHNFARATEFGDYFVGGKQRIGLVDIDWENDYENGSHPRKALRFIKSVCDNLQGIFQAMYVHPIVSDYGHLTKNGYPDANGKIRDGDINPLYTSHEMLDGVDYRLTDSENFAPLLEMSHYGETTMHGFNDGVRMLNAYGNNSNIEHYLARVTSMAEKNYSYLHSLGKDLCFIQAKLICDRGGNGWQYKDGNRQGGGGKVDLSHYLTRDQAFKSTMAVFFSGLHFHEWNRPIPNLNADSYNGFQFALNLLGTRKQFSETEKISAVDMRTAQAEFHLWKSKYKFVGESNFRQEEGYKLKDNTDNLLVRTMRLGNKLAIVVLNPYNVATKFNLTVACTNGGKTIEKSFTAADWQSCYPNEARKDYIFDIIEMK